VGIRPILPRSFYPPSPIDPRDSARIRNDPEGIPGGLGARRLRKRGFVPRSKVYIETTIISYLTALPSRELVLAAHQKLTLEWWQRRGRFDLYASEAVLQEAAAGHPEPAAHRLAALEGCTVIAVNTQVAVLARALLEAHALPPKAMVDALHVAAAAVHGIDYLLTWNCKHIANAATRGTIDKTCRDAGFEPPTICTPEELTENE
jgi:predicted nucleic acid-binding protein